MATYRVEEMRMQDSGVSKGKRMAKVSGHGNNRSALEECRQQ